MMSDAISVLKKGTKLSGRVYSYTIERVLGQGAFGVTYLASTSMKGPLGEVTVQVALKEFFAKELDTRLEDGTVSTRTLDGIAYKYAKAFQCESENLSKMKHPGIVNVLEAFEAKGTYYFSMEYLSGGSLDEKVRGEGIPEQEALALIRKTGEALAYMHERKVMHLDLKPKNIMLKGDDSPVIIDFGLSKQFDVNGEPESSSTIGLGTPGYAPIEQANQLSGRTFQPTLDIYALGATLYKMLTGSTPPTASDILNDGFPEAPLQEKGVSAMTISAIEKAMSAARKNRPQSVAAFLALLEAEPAPAAEPVSSASEETMIAPKAPDQKPVGKKKPKVWLWTLLACAAVAAIAAIVLGGKFKKDPYNGHAYVDLGLSVMWATCNVGASSDRDDGYYFAWGETAAKKTYSWENYRFNPSAEPLKTLTFSKYNTDSKRGPIDNVKSLDLSDDAARANWGGEWRTPTADEWKELREKCTWTWTNQDGTNGYRVTSKSNGKSIFLPAVGHRRDEALINRGSEGYYWSSSLHTSAPIYAYRESFTETDNNGNGVFRCFGFAVRPVIE